MIPIPVHKLLVEIAKKVGGKDGVKCAMEVPEVCLTALLLKINEEVTSVSAMLDSCVEESFFEDTIEAARQFLHRQKRRSAKCKHRRIHPDARRSP